MCVCGCVCLCVCVCVCVCDVSVVSLYVCVSVSFVCAWGVRVQSHVSPLPSSSSQEVGCCSKRYWGSSGLRVFAADGRPVFESRAVTALGASRGVVEAQAKAGLKHFAGRFVVGVDAGVGGSLTGRGGCCCPTLPGRSFLGARGSSGELRFVLPLPPARNCCHSLCQIFGAALCLPCTAIGACCSLASFACRHCVAALRCSCCGLKVLHSVTREFPRQVVRYIPVMDASGERLVACIVLQGAVDMTNRLTGYQVHVQTPHGMGYEDANLLVLLAWYFDAQHWAAKGPDAEIDAVAFNIGFGHKKK